MHISKKIFLEISDKLILSLGTDPRSHNEWLQSIQVVKQHMDSQSKKILELEEELEQLKNNKKIINRDYDTNPTEWLHQSIVYEKQRQI